MTHRLRILITVLLSIQINLVFAHNANEAYYTISISDGKTIVEGEFPWTLRKALMEYEPALTETKVQEIHDLALKNYFKSNLVLEDADGTPLPFIGFRKIEKEDHEHNAYYQLEYEGAEFSKLSNTLLFGSATDINHFYVLEEDGVKSEYTTTELQTSFELPSSSGFSLWWLTLLLVPALLLLRKRKA